MHYPTWRELREHINKMSDIELDDNISLHNGFDREYYPVQKIVISDGSFDELEAGATILVFDKDDF